MTEWSQKWAEYQRWADTHSEPDSRSPETIMRDIEALYWSYPEEVRRTDPDPAITGVQALHRAFALYERQRQLRIDTRTGG
jgi:hypothetical protein